VAACRVVLCCVAKSALFLQTPTVLMVKCSSDSALLITRFSNFRPCHAHVSNSTPDYGHVSLKFRTYIDMLSPKSILERAQKTLLLVGKLLSKFRQFMVASSSNSASVYIHEFSNSARLGTSSRNSSSVYGGVSKIPLHLIDMRIPDSVIVYGYVLLKFSPSIYIYEFSNFAHLLLSSRNSPAIHRHAISKFRLCVTTRHF